MLRCLLLAIVCLPLPALGAETRPLQIDDLFELKDVGDPQLSPDGKWVAYTVTSLDAEADKADTDIWMFPLGGGDAIRVTTSEESEWSPRWSPDGRYLAFLSGRDGKKTQVWLLNRLGGEASKPPKTAKPIVTRRLQFKSDGNGYLREIRSHLHVFDVKAKTSVQVTAGPFDDSDPAWSPDGQAIAFTSKRGQEPDLDDNSDIFLIAPKQGETPRALTTSPGADRSPAFGPDGQWLTYVEDGTERGDAIYTANHVAVVNVASGQAKPLTLGLDRNVASPRFSPDGRAVWFLLEDSGNQHLARVPAAGGAVTRPVAGERTLSGYDVGKQGEIVVLESQPTYPPEVSADVAWYDRFLKPKAAAATGE